MSPPMLLSVKAAPMAPVEIHRQSRYLYKKGSPACEHLTRRFTSCNPMRGSGPIPDLRQASSDRVDAKLLAGCIFEVKTLTKDLMIDPRNADGVAHIIRDDLHNVYEGYGFDATCNYVPQATDGQCRLVAFDISHVHNDEIAFAVKRTWLLVALR
jgi:hypothetical protein